VLQLPVLQHTPSTQLPEAHADATLHVAPRISFAAQMPSLQ
jgi:hypothetical protein